MHLKKLFLNSLPLLLLGTVMVYAAAPSGGYLPGATTDPDCAVGDTDCFVTLPTDQDNQNLTLSGTNLSIEDGNNVDLGSLSGVDTDDQTLTLSGSNLSITDGNSVTLPSFIDTNTQLTETEVDDYVANNGYLTGYTDTDDQTLTLSGSNLSIADGNSVSLSTIVSDSIWSQTGSIAYYNDGSVGIGTMSPSKKLEVAGTAQITSTADCKLDFNDNGDGADSFCLGTHGTRNDFFLYNRDANSYDLVVDNEGNVGIGTTAPNELLTLNEGKLAFRSNGGVGNNTRARIEGIYDVGGSNYGGALLFSVTNNTNVDTERMRITKEGNVGIGTTSPNARLSVADSGNLTSPSDILQVWSTGGQVAGGGPGIRFGDGTQSSNARIATLNNGSSGSDLTFETDGIAGDNLTEKMRILGNGNVGIGTSSPTRALHMEADSAILRIADKNNTASDNAAAAYIEFRGNDGQIGWIGDGSSGSNDMTVLAENEFRIATGGSGSPRLSVNTVGNVGIGTATPTYKLEVSGANADASINGVRVGKGGGDNTSNTATGNNALSSNTTGLYNTAVGSNSLSANTTGNTNTALGRASLALNTTGSNNTGVGLGALYANTTGGANTAIGRSALAANTTGTYNTATGLYSLYFNTTGTHNTANGVDALYDNTIGNSNTANGYNALYNNTTGNNNISLGYTAGDNLTTGDNNIIIGANTDAPSATADNQLNIGNWIYGSGGRIGVGTSNLSSMFTINSNTQSVASFMGPSNVDKFSLSSSASGGGVYYFGAVNAGSGSYLLFNEVSGNIGIGAGWSPRAKFDVVHASTATDAFRVADGGNNANTNLIVKGNGNVGIGTHTPAQKLDVNGNIAVSGTTVHTSDGRLKTNIEDIDNALERILTIKGVSYNWKKQANNTPDRQIGVIAQDVEVEFPELVLENGEYKSVNYSGLVGPIIEAMRELWEIMTGNSKEIEELQTENQELKIQLDTLLERVEKLENTTSSSVTKN